MALSVDTKVRPVYFSRDGVTADEWLYRMWGVQPGRTSSPRSGGECSFQYPRAVAQWLYAMWGITVPVDDAD